ncbi:MAG TPA: glutathione S-transferase family protein [Steroidobacteraceae bacterium]|nr:glutathione S-transferase family protein [Steroidobacteraceae bacterium]
MANIRVTALRWVPPPFQGQVRDLAVRWALEEAGVAYEENLVGPAEQASGEHRGRQPFGKIPVYEEDGLVLFESGAIVLHIAERWQLLPREAQARARALGWLFAALNSLDPDIIALGDIDHFHARETWAAARRPAVEASLRGRLAVVDLHLAGREYLAGEFSAADIMMLMVLRQLRHTTILESYLPLRAWRDRCQARPAFQRALAAQLAVYERHAPAASRNQNGSPITNRHADSSPANR